MKKHLSLFRASLLAVLVTTSACVTLILEDDRPCPCDEGWTCCEEAQVCVPKGMMGTKCLVVKPPPEEPPGFCQEPDCQVDQLVSFEQGEGPLYADYFSFFRSEEAFLWGSTVVHQEPRICMRPYCQWSIPLYKWTVPHVEEEPSWLEPVGLRGMQSLVLIPGTKADAPGTLRLRWCDPGTNGCGKAPDALVFQTSGGFPHVLLVGDDVLVASAGTIGNAPAGSILRQVPGRNELEVLVAGGEAAPHRYLKDEEVKVGEHLARASTSMGVSNGMLFWRAGQRIWSCPLTGCPTTGPVEQAYNRDGIDTLLVHGDFLYWTSRGQAPGLEAELFSVFRRRWNDVATPIELLLSEARIGNEVSTRIAVDEHGLYFLKETFTPNEQGEQIWTGAELRACPEMKCDTEERVLLRGGTRGDALYGLTSGPDGLYLHNGKGIMRVRPHTFGDKASQ
ncbi:hypothetical protein JQX13_39905 [Archangium violaceum]|uniref:hypothetical protein n=1 Tax=Archangium violaceum TaxID=83451 RepID=UPI00193AE866|nr:hypothetical protein [Archangium violaceum]QRK06226.1 hypothetical protein JQX13_39905 [Archangium violaceum]